MKKGSLEKGLKAAVVGALVFGLLSAGRPVAAQGVEAIMRARETLALTEDQISRLDAIRRDVVAQRSAEQAEIAELRSQLSAGQIRRSQLMAAQEERADEAQRRADDVRARVDAVLTEEQRAQVEQLRTRAERVGARRSGVGRGGRGGFGPGGPVGPRNRRGGGGFGL
jgi:hypothetical protein